MPSPPTTFEQTFADVADVQGWMTRDQARRLWDRASELEPPAQVVEIGSFQGRSAIVLARAAADGVDVVAIDPHAGNDRGPQEFEGYAEEAQSDHETFLKNLANAGVSDKVRHLRLFSQEAGPEVEGAVDLLYIDGAHRFAPARADIREWSARVRDGGTLLIHDSFSSVGVTLAILTTLLTSGEWRYVGRSQSMTEYRREPVRGLDRVTNGLRQVAQLPWFLRNVLIKALILAHLGRFTRLLGHREPTWPY